MTDAVDDRPAISVVIPTFNRLDSLRRTLLGVAGQVGVAGTIEVVVVSDGSTDGTDEFLLGASVPCSVTAIRQDNAGPGAARNRGLEVAHADVVLFLDDDVVPAPDAVARHLAAHDGRDSNLVVIGPMLTPLDIRLSPWVAWEQMMLAKQYAAMERSEWQPTARQFFTGNASLWVDRLREIKGFDQSLRRAEDVELGYRLAESGCRFHFDPTAVVWHYADRSLASWRGVARSYGRNDVRFARDFGHQWLLGTIAAEFLQRRRALRWLNRICLPRPLLRRSVAALIAACISVVPHRWSSAHLLGRALSALYSVEYYGAMADELGDGRRLLQIIEARKGGGA